jgi:PIN domain nuclease of toxin-antitoxin system
LRFYWTKVSTAGCFKVTVLQARSLVPYLRSPLSAELLPVTVAHALRVRHLTYFHKDPFDRMLVAQATLEGLVLGTQDPLMRPYAVPLLGLA